MFDISINFYVSGPVVDQLPLRACTVIVALNTMIVMQRDVTMLNVFSSWMVIAVFVLCTFVQDV